MGKITITLFLLFGLLGSGCGSECGDLQDICDRCSGADKTACEEIAETDDATSCEEAIADFDAMCE